MAVTSEGREPGSWSGEPAVTEGSHPHFPADNRILENAPSTVDFRQGIRTQGTFDDHF
jgi:hypothetical protein